MIFKTEQQEIPQLKPLLKKPPKKEPPRGGRWTIFWLFLATLLGSLIFYLKTEFPVFWRKATAPLVISNLPQERKFDPSPVLSEIENLTKDLRGSWGVYVYRLDSKESYGIKKDEVFPAASLVKLPVMLRLYQEAEAGNINLETKYKLTEKSKIFGAGILQNKTAGTTYPYRQLAEFMGQYSDNTAFGVLVKILGKEKIQQTIDELGMRKTFFLKNETSPEDMGIFFQKLYQGNILTNEHGEEILGFLSKTAFEDWIPAGVPEEIRVAHKIGKDLGTFSDGGIVFSQKPFVLVVMSKNAREREAQEALPKITKIVWEFENSK
jgi:beta-lactamase class A